jgi:hypothetical protein
MYLLFSMACFQELEEVLEKLIAKVVDVLFRVFADHQHLPDVTFTLRVHLEAVGIATLFLTRLAIPAQTLEALGLELIVQVLCRTDLGFRHFGDTVGWRETNKVALISFWHDSRGAIDP